MRYFIFIGLLLSISLCLVVSCKKYQDTKAVSDPRLNNPYCNDPSAVNYNWGFPGRPDNSVCFYPTDVFKGVYELHDSIFLTSSGLFIFADTITIVVNKHSQTKFAITGFCSSGDSLLFTAGVNYSATTDTTIGDTTTAIRGQKFCSIADTVNGTLIKDRLNDSVLYFNLRVASDTGVTTTHLGTAHLKHK